MFSSLFANDFFQNFIDAFLKYVNEALYFIAICMGLAVLIAAGSMSRMDAAEAIHALIWARVLWPMWNRVIREWLTAR